MPQRNEYPPRWNEFCDLCKASPKQSAHVLNDGDVTRFANRYRIARAFSSITFQDDFSMKAENVDAYGAMMRTFLAFSAWEVLSMKEDDGKYGSCVGEDMQSQIRKQIRKRYKSHAFIEFLAQRADKRAELILRGFMNGESTDPLSLAGGVRNIFAHGFLPANAKGTTPQATRDICGWLADYVMVNIDRRFNELLDAAQNGTSPSRNA